MRRCGNAAAEIVPAASPVAPSSEQELHILKLLRAGKNFPEIAEELRISLQTRRNQLHHIDPKLRTHNRLEPGLYAIRRKSV